MLQEGGVVVPWVFGSVESRHQAKPERRFRFWKRACLCSCLGARARDLGGGALKHIHVHVPPEVPVMAVVEADDHVREIPGLVVAAAVYVAARGCRCRGS